MERMVEAVERATGKRLSYAAALANIVVHKTLHLLEEAELTPESVDLEKMLRLGLRAAEVALAVERTDRSVREEAARKVEERLQGSVPPEILEAVKREIYGL
jgi:DNA-binding NarL/FixJ family response regulator